MNKLLILAIGLITISCSTAIHTTKSVSVANTETKNKPQMTYLFFEVEKVNGQPKVKLIQQKTLDGNMLLEDNDTRKSNNDFYKISLLDSQNKEVKVFELDNPLEPVMEVYSGEEISKQKGKLEKSGFFIKYNNVAGSPIGKVSISHEKDNSSKVIFYQNL